MKQEDIKFPSDWNEMLHEEFEKSYMHSLMSFLREEKNNGKTIYPNFNEIFNAFKTTTLSNVKVVLLGQDPYHGEGQAHGLSFSVKSNVKTPPSLQNIFKELQRDLGCVPPNHGNLQKWANQGVLLLNTVLSVNANEPASHQGKGWEIFTDTVIRKLQEKKENVVFLLWGKFAQSKIPLIQHSKHLILQAPHPSPFSAHTGFFGCKHFSKCNAYLKENNLQEIDWQLKSLT